MINYAQGLHNTREKGEQLMYYPRPLSSPMQSIVCENTLNQKVSSRLTLFDITREIFNQNCLLKM